MISRAVRGVAYLTTGALTGAVTAVLLLALVTLGVIATPIVVGLPILLAAAFTGLPVAWVERRRLRLVGAFPVADPHRAPNGSGLRPWLACRLGERATWRELGYALLLAGLLWWLDLIVVGYCVAVPVSLLTAPLFQGWFADGEVRLLKVALVSSPGQAWAAAALGIASVPLAGLLVATYTTGRCWLARFLLTPRPDAAGEGFVELTRSRARLVDAFDTERRRIERNLHDGTQQRLVALGMTLGLARLAEPDEMRALVERAYGDARCALEEMQEFLRGVHPRILTDRGLPAAVAELADRSIVPVTVDLRLADRLPSSVEIAAYFVVCEALTNVVKHSGSDEVTVAGWEDGDRLVVEVRDEGIGGADAAAGSGLTGLADRVAAAAGTLTLVSPPGGPTLLRVELPCVRTAPSV